MYTCSHIQLQSDNFVHDHENRIIQFGPELTYQITKVVHGQGEAKNMSVGIVLINIHLIGQPDQVSLQLLQLTSIVPLMSKLPFSPILFVQKLWLYS